MFGKKAPPPPKPPLPLQILSLDNVWLENVIAVLPGDATGQQMVTAWAQKTQRKRPVRGVFYAGPYVISGTAMTKESDHALSLGFIVAVLDATVHCVAQNTRLPDLRSAAMLLGTERIVGYEPA